MVACGGGGGGVERTLEGGGGERWRTADSVPSQPSLTVLVGLQSAIF